MTNFAVIEDGKVINIIVSDSKINAEEATGKICVEYTDHNLAYIGLGYDGLTFEQPPIPVIVEESTSIVDNEIVAE
jgi:3'-phosphoadenosine 5'-phosphosulfate (PAPS) 3'-phosphatase